MNKFWCWIGWHSWQDVVRERKLNVTQPEVVLTYVETECKDCGKTKERW